MTSIEDISNFVKNELTLLVNRDFTPEECKSPIFSDRIDVSPWAVIHIIDAVNKQYGISFDVSEIVANPIFSIDDFSSSVYQQLFEINNYEGRSLE